jgi:response regulator NasT
MSARETEHLRVLIANERKDRLALVAAIVIALGHEVIAREIEVGDVGAVTTRERPDVALVGLGKSSTHALDLVDRIVREAACPVIVLLHARDPAFVKEASKRGVFAHISDVDVEDWQSSIDIVLRRFGEYHELEGAFGRRALTERAKGILMETPLDRRSQRLRHAARALAHRQPQAHRHRRRGRRDWPAHRSPLSSRWLPWQQARDQRRIIS